MEDCGGLKRYIVVQDTSRIGNWTPRKLYTKDEAIAKASEHAREYPSVTFYVAKLAFEVSIAAVQVREIY